MNYNVKTEIKSLSIITVGMFLFAIGLNLFLIPSNILTTGVMGFSQELAIIINKFVEIGDISPIIYWIINIPTIFLGWKKIGKKFTIRTFYAVTVTTLFTAIIPSTHTLVEDPLLGVFAGSIIIGFGAGLALKVGGSSGGTDIISLYISIFLGKSFGTYNLILNSFVIILAVFLTGDITVGILMFISTYLISLTVDKTHNSVEKHTLFIITKNGDQVREAILNSYRRGLTIFNTEGGLTREPNTTIMMTVERGQLLGVLDTIKKTDDKAFINIYKVSSVVGEFENHYKNLL